MSVSREEFEKVKKDLEETKTKLDKITHDLGKYVCFNKFKKLIRRYYNKGKHRGTC